MSLSMAWRYTVVICTSDLSELSAYNDVASCLCIGLVSPILTRRGGNVNYEKKGDTGLTVLCAASESLADLISLPAQLYFAGI